MTSTLGQAAPVTAPSRRPSAPRPRRRRRAAVAAAGALVALVALSVVLVDRGNGTAADRVGTFAVPTAYSVTYAVTTPGAKTTTERLWVRRPFDSVDITYDGPSTASPPSLVVVNRLGVQVLKAMNAQAALLHVPAAVASADVRPDLVVPAAMRAHRMTVVGRATVLGRSCEVLRTAGSLRAGPLPTLRAGAHVDTCIDAAGIVLRETQVSGGRTVSDRRAVLVETGAAAVTDAPFALSGTPTPYDSGGGAFTPLTLTSRPPGSSWALDKGLQGFRHVGRFAVVPPQPQLFGQGGNGFGSMGMPGGLVTEMDDVFVRGVDVLVLQQGSTLNGATFAAPANSLDVDLGPLGGGQLLLAGNVATVVAEPGNHKGFVRLSGTLPADDLVALMRNLTRQPGGTLTRLPGAAG